MRLIYLITVLHSKSVTIISFQAVQMQEFEASARKLASCHPLLTLRNLPLVAASLKGRTEYDFSFFRRHGCQMAKAKLLDCRRLALRA